MGTGRVSCSMGTALAWLISACGDAEPLREAQVQAGAPASEQAVVLPQFCARSGDNKIRDLFCGGGAKPQSLRELEMLLDLHPERQGNTPSTRSAALEGYSRATFALGLGHSTALSGRLVSPINPRAIILGNDAILTFQRGVQRVELATPARGQTRVYDFYLLEFERPCNAEASGCGTGELYTERIEHDWTRVTLRDDEELKNTALDCRQCHARGQPRSGLLMRELEKPWTHFFLPIPPVDPKALPGVTGIDLSRDFGRAHGDEPYAGVPSATLQGSSPPFLEGLAGRAQPLFFDSQTIELERWPNGPKSDPQPSPTWARAYDAFKRGEQLALPYEAARATDADKQARLTEAYTRYRNGELPADELPDLSDIFPDDPVLRARIGLEVEPDASAPEALIQACGSCHNDVLDQSLSRARFNVDLSRLDRAALDRAIARIELPPSAAGAMPPPEFRQLTAETRERVIAYLRQEPTPADERLVQAAAMGMAGGPTPP